MSNASPFTQLWKQSEQKRELEIEQAKLDIIEKDLPPPTPTTPPRSTSTPTPTSISPEKNFTKVANSIKPEIFRGTSQKTYMALYRLTRGAIVPKRIVKITRNDLMAFADVSEVTLVKHLTYLERIAGLVKKTSVRGDNDGANYEVFVPEEVDPPPPTPTPSTTPTSIKKVDGGTIKKVGVGGGGNIIENTDTYEDSKTSLKTNTKNDDEADALFSGFIEKFQTAAKKLTGAPLSKYEREKWERLADLLVLELETASRHTTNPVSSVPAFLTKVLSSKLLNQKQPAERMSKPKSGAKPDTVGKYYPELDGSDDEIKPLNDESRQAALDLIREFKDDKEFLDSYRKWYTEEDWKWLLKELKIND
jgi:hypothetical protein